MAFVFFRSRVDAERELLGIGFVAWAKMTKRQDKQKRSLKEQILDLPPSGLKLDGNVTVNECRDILNHLERKGLKSGSEKIAYVKEMAATSGDEYLRDIGVTPDAVDQVELCIKGQQWLANTTRQLDSMSESVRAMSEPLRNAMNTLATPKMFSGPFMEMQLKEIQRSAGALGIQTQYLRDALQFAQYWPSHQYLMSDMSHHLLSANAKLAISADIPNLKNLRDQWQYALRDITALSSIVRLATGELDKWRTTQLSVNDIELIKPPKETEEDLHKLRQGATEWQERLSRPEYRDNPEEDLRQTKQLIGILLVRIEVLETDVKMWERRYKKLEAEVSTPKPLDDDRDYR